MWRKLFARCLCPYCKQANQKRLIEHIMISQLLPSLSNWLKTITFSGPSIIFHSFPCYCLVLGPVFRKGREKVLLTLKAKLQLSNALSQDRTWNGRPVNERRKQAGRTRWTYAGHRGDGGVSSSRKPTQRSGPQRPVTSASPAGPADRSGPQPPLPYPPTPASCLAWGTITTDHHDPTRLQCGTVALFFREHHLPRLVTDVSFGGAEERGWKIIFFFLSRVVGVGGLWANAHPHPTAWTRPPPPVGYPFVSLEKWKKVWLTGW